MDNGRCGSRRKTVLDLIYPLVLNILNDSLRETVKCLAVAFRQQVAWRDWSSRVVEFGHLCWREIMSCLA